MCKFWWFNVLLCCNLDTFIWIIKESGKDYICHHIYDIWHSPVFNSQGYVNSTHSLINTGISQNLTCWEKNIVIEKGSVSLLKFTACFLAIISQFPQPVSSIRRILLSPTYPSGNSRMLWITHFDRKIKVNNYFYLCYYL